jgi:ribokinase
MTLSRIVVLGSVNMDVAVRVPQIPQRGETLAGEDAILSLGGKGANQAIAAVRLGGKVSLVALIGGDAFGNAALDALRGEALDLTGLCQLDGIATGVAMIAVAPDGANSIVVAPGANARLMPTDLTAHTELIRTAGVLLLQNEVPVASQLAAADLVRAASGLVIIDPAPAAGVSDDLISRADIITPNETEAGLLTGFPVTNLESGLDAARQLVSRGARVAVVKLGRAGVVYAGAEGEGHVAAPQVNTVDTVAAGDCFNGALAVALMEKLALPAALDFACRAAAVSVTRQGASASMPFRRELVDVLGG